jgi:hypothetical protein
MPVDRRPAELEVSRVAGALLAQAMLRVFPESDEQQVQESAFLIWHLSEATMRLAVTCTPEEERALVEAFKRMPLREVMEPRCLMPVS